MTILAAALAAVSLVLLLVARAQRSKALDMRATETSTAADLAALASDVAKEIGPGSFTRVVELKGTAEAAPGSPPLVAEMSGTPCVYCRAVATREYEERYEEVDKDGNRRSGTRRGSETVSSNERRAPFALRDGTGAVEIDLEGASVEAERTLSRFEPGEGRGAFSLGSFNLDLASLARAAGGRRTVGYRFEEWAIPIGRRLYVLGEADDSGGRLRVRKPGSKGARFIVSVKSEEELVKAATGLATGLTVAAALLGAGALVLAVLLILGILS